MKQISIDQAMNKLTIETNLTKENIGILVSKLRDGLWNIADLEELKPEEFHSTGNILLSKNYWEKKQDDWPKKF